MSEVTKVKYGEYILEVWQAAPQVWFCEIFFAYTMYHGRCVANSSEDAIADAQRFIDSLTVEYRGFELCARPMGRGGSYCVTWCLEAWDGHILREYRKGLPSPEAAIAEARQFVDTYYLQKDESDAISEG